MSPRFSPRRELGRTGFVATQLGIGDLADRSVPLEACVATLRRALDFGLNLVDTAPSYENGYSEEVVGHALAGRRDGVFVIDKIDHFDRPVLPQAGESLARLGLASVDAFVLHGVREPAQWDELLRPEGRFSELEAAVRAGRRVSAASLPITPRYYDARSTPAAAICCCFRSAHSWTSAT
jgi:aryl-alcohol dehydrogenase-like predicted oxidoreductase